MGDPVPQDSPLTPSQPVPANVAQVAVASGLGTFERVYVPKRRSWALIIVNLFLALLTLFVLVGFWLLWVLFRTPNMSRSQAARRVYLYERGFIVADRPEDPQVYRFEDIDTVFQKIVSQRTYGFETARSYLYTINT